jgi:3alpha(or 20beta)-hydroxysteroid dehydrogenase
MGRFDNTTVLISGGARGIGAAHARAFVEAGARVAIGDVRDELGMALADELGDAARYLPLDISSEESWAAFVAGAEAEFGPASVLVTNAAVLQEPALLVDLDLAEWRRVLDVNLSGTFLGIKHAAPSIRRAGGGSIVTTASALGRVGTPQLGGYVASKWAIRGLTQTAALELARDGIRVNCVLPGYVDTNMNDQISEENTRPYAIPRFADPREITAVVLFLASSDASFVTGAEYVVDGGALAGAVVEIV